MKNNPKNSSYLDKFTVRKVQEGITTRQTLLPDSLDAWIECYLRLAVSGVRSEEVAQKIALHLSRFQDFFQQSYGHDRLSTCLRRDVQAWQNALISQGLAHSTINNHLASLSAFTTWAHTHNPDLFPVGDPAKGVGELGLPPLEPRALSPEQVRSLKNLCDRLERFHQVKGRRRTKENGAASVQAHGRPWRDRAIVYVLLSTGLRREELVNLDLDQIEPDTPEALRAARRARITKVRGKGKTERTVFLSADARLALADYLERERPRDATPMMTALFLSANSIAARGEDGRLSPQAINLLLSQIGCWHDAELRDPARHISPLRPHDLRHTFAFHLAKVTGADAYELERRLGHRSPRYITLDPALVTLAQEGAKVYREEFDLLYRREASHSNAMWQADHTLLPIWLLDEHGKPAKPWLTAILDDYSRSVAGYFLSFQKATALQTALTLHQAIWRKDDPRWHVCGIPSTFYTDHGSDFISHHIEQVAADLKIALIFSLPGAPRGRGKMERFFGTVKQMLIPELPGYAPKGSTGMVPELTLPAFDALFRAWLLGDYHQRVQSEIESAPQARWEAEGFLPRMPESLEQLDLLLLTVAKGRRVQQDGIHFQGQRYLDTTLAAYVGEDVTIRYDPRDLAEIRVFYREHFLCRAICAELAGQKISLKEITQVRNERRKLVRQGIDERLAVVEQFIAVHQPDPPRPAPDPVVPPPTPRLKRYLNE